MIKKRISTKKIGARYTAVLLESMDKKIDHVLDGHDMLNRKIDGVKDKLTGEINSMKDMLGVLKIDTTDLRSSAKQILKYLSEVENELQDIAGRMGRKADQEQIASLHQRVARIELVLKKYLSGNKNLTAEL